MIKIKNKEKQENPFVLTGPQHLGVPFEMSSSSQIVRK